MGATIACMACERPSPHTPTHPTPTPAPKTYNSDPSSSPAPQLAAKLHMPGFEL